MDTQQLQITLKKGLMTTFKGMSLVELKKLDWTTWKFTLLSN